MLQSPAKRRKTTATESVPANEQQRHTPDRSAPTTPSRASYLSPTKASLARSHPHLINHNHGRSLTGPRGKLLRDELLGKTNTTTSHQEKAKILTSAKSYEHENNPEDHKRADERPLDQITNSAKRAPLQESQPTGSQSVSGRSESIDRINQGIVPRLIKRSEITSRSVSRPRSNEHEPELPPTPVQLGLHAPPERPRGLSSSSPRGSKSGSGRRRVRVRNDQSATSSPLKPRASKPTMRDLESQQDVPEEGPESQTPLSDPPGHEQPKEIIQKTKLLIRLQKELSSLQAQVNRTEEGLNANSLMEDAEKDRSLMELLKAGHQTISPQTNEFEQGTSAEYREPLYRDLFAPGNLQLQTKTTTKMIKGHAKVIHHISITPPSPWPSEIYSADFEVLTDAEDIRVEKVTWVDVMPGHRQAIGIQDELYDWIQARLSGDLHSLDLGGLVWGLGSYFTSSIDRAKVFRALSLKYRNDLDKDEEDEDEEDHEEYQGEIKTGVVDKKETTTLLRYLSTSQLTFEAMTDADSTNRTTRRTREAAPKIMAVWKLQPTWNGTIKSVCEIVPSGIPGSAHQPVTDLFDQILKVAGFEKAFEAVWDLVVRSAGERDGKHVGKAAAVGPGNKRKRFS